MLIGLFCLGISVARFLLTRILHLQRNMVSFVLIDANWVGHVVFSMFERKFQVHGQPVAGKHIAM